MRIAPVLVVLLAACGGVSTEDQAPTFTAPTTGASQTDPDADGVVGDGELCLNDAEDRDGFEDQDGCPDPDNDQDRIADIDDRCPNDAETFNGFDDADGCPDQARVVVTELACPIIIDRIYFRNRSAAIQIPSKPMLDAIAATLLGNARIERVAIVGTSARNERDGNTLSLARAEAVRTELVHRGVDALRLDVMAAGTRLDIGGARERNRRVDFYITRMDGADVDVPALAGLGGP